MLADAINRAGSAKPEEIRKALIATDIPGAQTIMPWKGIKFDETGQNTLCNPVIQQVVDGTYKTVWPFDLASREVMWNVGSFSSCRRRMTLEALLQILSGGLLMGLIYALVAAGLSLIFGLMDVVNFAHGEMMMLAMYAVFVLWGITGADPIPLLPVVALLLFGVGVAIYHGMIARALSVQFNRGMVQIFVTFGLAIFIRGAAQFAFGGEFRSVTTTWLADRSLNLGGVYLPLPQVAAGLVCLLAFAGLLAVSRTEFGRALEATREDRDAVALIGIDRDRIFSLGWGLGAATVGVAGVMLAGFYYVGPNVGANFAIVAYVTVALGGFGSLLGALVAGVLIGEVEAITAALLEPSLKQVGVFAIYLAVLMFRPRGLFGKL